MDVKQLVKNLWLRCSISYFVTFACLLVLIVMNIRQDSRIGKIEEASLANRLTSKKPVDNKPDDKPKPGPGSLYTRWGRTTCPPTSKLVYNGAAAGQYHMDTGGGSNLLCLPNDPMWANYTREVESGGYIYGSEYEVFLQKKEIFSNANAKSLQNHNIPCAVCLTRQPAVVMMLPARTHCYTGWTREYSGYLMVGHPLHKGRDEYVCVDYEPEADPSGSADEKAAPLYFVQAQCGALQCPPYYNGIELTCVVCSKY